MNARNSENKTIFLICECMSCTLIQKQKGKINYISNKTKLMSTGHTARTKGMKEAFDKTLRKRKEKKEKCMLQRISCFYIMALQLWTGFWTLNKPQVSQKKKKSHFDVLWLIIIILLKRIRMDCENERNMKIIDSTMLDTPLDL